MDSHREMRVDMSLLLSTELRYIKRESPVWMATLNIDIPLKSGKKAAEPQENLT